MRKSIITTVILLALPTVCLADNFGSTFGALTTAKTLDKGNATFGGSFGVSDATSFIGSFSYGLSDKTDARVRLGMLDHSGFDSELAFGFDLKWNISGIFSKNKKGEGSNNLRKKGARAIDLSAGPIFEYVKMDFNANLFLESMKVTQIGVQLLVSSTFRQPNGGALTPYGRFNIRNESISVDLVSGAASSLDISNSQLALGLNGGVAYAPSQTYSLYGEFQIDGNDGVFLGVHFML